MAHPTELDPDQSYGLIVLQPSKVQQIPFKYVAMNLNYRYELTILKSATVNDAAGALSANASSIRALFIIQKEKIANRMFLYALGLQGKRPLFFILAAGGQGGTSTYLQGNEEHLYVPLGMGLQERVRLAGTCHREECLRREISMNSSTRTFPTINCKTGSNKG